MKRVWTLVAATVVALAAGAGPARAAAAMGDGAVLSVSVVPATGKAEVVIGVEGDVSVRDFTLRNPDKVVIDISGATLGLPATDSYDKVARGGILNVRYSQYRKGVVRLVLTLDGPREYSLVRGAHDLRITIDGPAGSFAAWKATGDAPAKPAMSDAPATTRVASTEPAPAKPAADKPAAPAPSVSVPAAAPTNAVAALPTPKPATPKPTTPKPAAEKSAPAPKVAQQPVAPQPAPTVAQQGAPSAAPKTAKPVEAKRAEPVVAEAPAPEPMTIEPLAQPKAQPAPARAERREERSERAEKSEHRVRQQSQQPRITIAFENSDIHDVLAAFAAFSGRTIIPSSVVKGSVTAEIVNQPWDVSMRAILNANGFDATEDGNGLIIVDTFEHIASRRSTEPLATRSIRLNYVRAAQVAPLMQPRLSRDCGNAAAPSAQAPGGMSGQGGQNCLVRGAVTPDSLTNSVAITDVPSALADLEAYARSLDIRQPQVNIKAKIILIDRTQLEALGLRYDLGTAQQFFNDIVPRLDSTGKVRTDAGQVFLGGNQVSAIANAQARVPSSALSLIFSTAFGDYSLSTFLEALQQSTLLDVQAEPSATVLNNRTANLTAGTEVPLRVIDASAGGSQGGQGGGNFPRATVQMKPTGIILNVTPSVTNNRQVQMRLHVENSDVVPQGSDAYLFPRQTVDNEVLVADGETAVMGGLTQTTVRYTKSGIPILVDLPLIGRLFGLTQRQEQKRDLLILITPHIIDEGQAPQGSPRE